MPLSAAPPEVNPQVKVCGLTRRADAEVAVGAGAAFLGVVLAPGGARSVSAAHAAALFDGLPVRRVGVFVNATLAELCRDARVAGLDVLQLHGDETPERIGELRARGPWKIWKAVRPRGGTEFVDAVERFAPGVDGILLDGWSPHARGGTGAAFPWEEIAPLRHLLPAGVELIAAGGLRADNVARAALLLRPTVVDVSSGVERTPGIKDPDAVRAFVSAARVPHSEEHLPEPTHADR